MQVRKMNDEVSSEFATTDRERQEFPSNSLLEGPVICAKGKELFLGTACIQSPPDNIHTCGPLSSTWNASMDFCRYYIPATGIVRVDRERWLQAQSGEAITWHLHGNPDGQSLDRDEQHAVWFDQYNTINGTQLGRILEIGSGPFTQTKTVLNKIQGRGGALSVESITLADPLMLFYHAHVPKNQYNDASLAGFQRFYIAAGGEDVLLRAEYDTVIMMNVLEHCRDALRVLDNLHAAVRPGGVLVFSERWYDAKWARYEATREPFWDAMHPINAKRSVIELLLSRYAPLHRRDFSREGDYPEDEGVYFVGVKKK